RDGIEHARAEARLAVGGAETEGREAIAAFGHDVRGAERRIADQAEAPAEGAVLVGADGAGDEEAVVPRDLLGEEATDGLVVDVLLVDRTVAVHAGERSAAAGERLAVGERRPRLRLLVLVADLRRRGDARPERVVRLEGVVAGVVEHQVAVGGAGT